MHYIGIDVAKSFHVAVILDECANKPLASLKFDNTQEGFKMFLEWLSSHKVSYDDCVVGLEATGILFEISISISKNRSLMLYF